jgi:hypothetical protein
VEKRLGPSIAEHTVACYAFIKRNTTNDDPTRQDQKCAEFWNGDSSGSKNISVA